MINNEYEEWTFLPKVLDNVSTNITFEDFISNNKILLTILYKNYFFYDKMPIIPT
jgi:hypothetical protein